MMEDDLNWGNTIYAIVIAALIFGASWLIAHLGMYEPEVNPHSRLSGNLYCELAKFIPDAEADDIRVSSESDSYIHIYVCHTSFEWFRNYVDICNKAGYNIDIRSDNTSYSAESENGLYISLNYHEPYYWFDKDGNEVSITLTYKS